MFIQLNHTIIPCADKKISAHFYQRLFNLQKPYKVARFHAMKLNDDLTFLFDYQEDFSTLHFAFKVDDEYFETIFNNIKKEKLYYGSDAYDLENMEINHWHEGKGVYFRDPNGHILELLTQDKD